jgi:hypothetical protein
VRQGGTVGFQVTRRSARAIALGQSRRPPRAPCQPSRVRICDLRGPTARFRRRIAGRSQLMDSASHFPSACASNITLSAAVARLRQRTRRRRLAGAIALVVRTTKVATRLRVGGERNERKESDAPDTGIRVYCSAADATTAMTSWLARAVCRRRRARGRARPPAGGGAVAAGGSPFVAAAHAAAPAPATRIVIEANRSYVPMAIVLLQTSGGDRYGLVLDGILGPKPSVAELHSPRFLL